MPHDRPNPKSRENSGPAAPTGAERLQKVLAAAGVGSRRDCEELIQQGRVEIDKQVVTELGTKVDPLRCEIRVDGTVLKQPKRVYYALNKPEGVVSTNYDQSGRTRIIDLLPNEERLFPVGRLDRFSEGLIVVTNDGAFANRLTHPRYGVEKTYLVRVAGDPGEKELVKLRKGIHLSDGLAKIVSLRVKGRHKQSTDLEIILNEGKNREIRRILARVGHKVLALKRTAVGTLRLGELPVGAYRKLMPQEVTELMTLAKRRRKEQKRSPVPGNVAAAAAAKPSAASPEKKLFAKPVKPVQGKRSVSPYPAPPKSKPAPPPADDLLRLEDFLPPLPDDEGDEIGAPQSSMGPARPGRVLDYGDEPGKVADSKPQPHTPKPDLRDRNRDQAARKPGKPKSGRKFAGGKQGASKQSAFPAKGAKKFGKRRAKSGPRPDDKPARRGKGRR